jgi:CO dehydrogenase nickel-insertion accessory protein CooC1
VLQGKGGVGKTYIASLIAQYLRDKGEPVACLDTDPVNASFARIPALAAKPIDLLIEDKINVEEMDAMATEPPRSCRSAATSSRTTSPA